MAEGALHGVRVLEFTQIVAGPYSCMLLSDMGAEVVKIEAPEGDNNRRSGSAVPGTAKAFQWLNRGKKSLVLDVETDAGREALYRLVPQFDVFVTNYRANYTERYGIDYETLAKLNPKLVYARVSGFGLQGPLADAQGIELVLQAYSGIMAEEGRVDDFGAPRSSNTTWFVDVITGTTVALGVVSALRHRDQTGEGQVIDAVLLRSAMAAIGQHIMQEPVADAIIVGDAVQDARQQILDGTAYGDVVRGYYAATHNQTNIPRPYFSGYTVKDGAIFLGTVTPRHRREASRIIGVEGSPTLEERFDPKDPADVARAAQVKQDVIANMRTRTMDEWLGELRAAGIPVAPVRFPPELADDPQASQYMVELDDPMTGPQKQLRSVFDMSATPVHAGGPAPTLGQHTEQLLGAAGFTAEELARLREAGATI